MLVITLTDTKRNANKVRSQVSSSEKDSLLLLASTMCSVLFEWNSVILLVTKNICAVFQPTGAKTEAVPLNG